MTWIRNRKLPFFERIPVRWRIAITTAGLTLLILVCFALVLGNVVGNRIRSDFREELRSAARSLAAETSVHLDSVAGFVVDSPPLKAFALPEDAQIKVLDQYGRPIAGTNPGINLGAPGRSIRKVGELSVASEAITAPSSLPAYVQYARPDTGVNDTVARLWFFLVAGVVGGTLLALLAGLAVADRAMRPVKALTGLASRISRTRDPSERIPVPATDDEVGELARTMDGMLQALDEARSEREQSLERQREFVADASHELRTPLTSIHANLELLQAAAVGSEDDRHAVDSALSSTKRMSGLVSDLLLLARADAGRRAGDQGPRPGDDRRRRARGGSAARGQPPDREPSRRPPAARGQPRRAPSPDPQPARERRPAYAREDHRRAHRPPRRGRGAARGAR